MLPPFHLVSIHSLSGADDKIIDRTIRVVGDLNKFKLAASQSGQNQACRRTVLWQKTYERSPFTGGG